MNERLSVRSLIAAVRSATPGVGFELANVQPFAHGRVAFTHNGFITDFRHGPQRAIRERLGRDAYESIEGSSDSEHIFALVLEGTGALTDAVREAIGRPAARAAEVLEWVFSDADDRLVAKLPRLAPLVARAADAGDGEAREILASAGLQLADLAVAAARQLWPTRLPNELSVARCGGVWAAGGSLIEPFEARLHDCMPQAIAAPATLPPVGGALLLAMGAERQPVASAVVANLRAALASSGDL
jgi:hypothetical protein